MEILITIVHVFTCFFLILVVLLQSGKGGGLGAAGGGASQTVFGGRGAGDFLTRLTGITAAIFMSTSMILSLAAAYTGGDLSKKAQQFNQSAKPLPQNEIIPEDLPEEPIAPVTAPTSDVAPEPATEPAPEVEPTTAPTPEPATQP